MKTKQHFSLALLTDLYQLTMAYGYWKTGVATREAVFHLFFRKRPFNGGIAIAAGLEMAVDFIQTFRFDSTDLAYLETLKTVDGSPLFEPAFLDYLSTFRFTCDLDAMPEGTAAFPHQPLLRVQGPILQAQLLESPLLNIVNFQTLIATKASRICWAARPDPVVEFGLRRAQGIDGALSASRAAYIGGCESTSNVLAGKLYGIPVRGTHAHSWVMAFDDEEAAFEAWTEVMPKNCIFLVDTYDTIAGVKKAIHAAQKLRKKGVDMLGVRLDSGDLAQLSIEIRKLLDSAGFPHAKIMASNELDETIINDLKHQGCTVNLWGVGTNLVTAKDQPALDGVYKLAAIKDIAGQWQYKLKVSENSAKITTPGILQVRRYFNDQGNIADMLYDLHSEVAHERQMIDSLDPSRSRVIGSGWHHRDLLVPVLRQGKLVYQLPTLKEIQRHALSELTGFPASMRRFLFPQPYFAGFAKSLYDLKARLIDQVKEEG
jgi:nicotinate phosphoribosyltransferase